jgi:hypothetical protein
MSFKLSFATSLVALAAVSSVHVVSSSRLLSRNKSIIFNGPVTAESNGIQNIHIKYNLPIDGELSIHFGGCEAPEGQSIEEHHHRVGTTAIGNHPLAKRNAQWKDSRPERFVWIVPEGAPDGGCLHAYVDEELIGSSDPIKITKKFNRCSVPLADIADAEGPWFDGVQYLKEKEPDKVFVAQEKQKKIGILGGGMAGLMSAVRMSGPIVRTGTYDVMIVPAGLCWIPRLGDNRSLRPNRGPRAHVVFEWN